MPGIILSFGRYSHPPSTTKTQSPNAQTGMGLLFAILSRIEGFTACFPSRTFWANFSFFWRISNAVGWGFMSRGRSINEDTTLYIIVWCIVRGLSVQRRERNESSQRVAVRWHAMTWRAAHHLELGVGVDVNAKERFRRASSSSGQAVAGQTWQGRRS